MKDRIEREDILKELFNISVGKSASMLSEIINRKILLNVPNLKILDLNEKTMALDSYLSSVVQGTIMVSSIAFEDEMKGKASLIFPADKMRTFINLCLNENDENQLCDMNFTDIDFDIIKEIGNIILNSIIGEIGNYLKIKLSYTLPEVKMFNKIDFEKNIKSEEYAYIIMLYITFKIDDSEIEGAIIINLTLNSLSGLLNKAGMIEDDFCE
ncbi:CheY-P phosphatase CheC [Clostridium liquoris]|uniref:CheY-P phosphatase CheC n=1 Tax=Clostridium liquoris TaxID=1289519 RepID=A0A2T0B585_9CLOT|nr:chemotaxis protein CheC [Clostridium liquoris]PRR79054.1 CheY-P phosphatase CheC [Clostridium liquoris]